MAELTMKELSERLTKIESILDGTWEVKVPIELASNDQMPIYAHPTDAGADLIANKDFVLRLGESVIVPTGVKMAIPVGFEVQIRPRSGISAKTTIRESNSPGTIDTGYRDDIGVILYNDPNPVVSFKNPDAPVVYVDGSVVPDEDIKKYIHDDIAHKGTVIIRKGDRIAQMVLAKSCKAKFVVVDSVAEIGENRNGGFGHTGVN